MIAAEELVDRIRDKWCVTGARAKNVVVIGPVDKIAADILEMLDAESRSE